MFKLQEGRESLINQCPELARPSPAVIASLQSQLQTTQGPAQTPFTNLRDKELPTWPRDSSGAKTPGLGTRIVATASALGTFFQLFQV